MVNTVKRGNRIFAVVLAVVFGFTTIMISAQTAEAAVIKPKSITLTATSRTVDVKGKITVSVKSVKPANAGKKVTWKSSNTKVAKVSSKGVVTGIKKGTVKITATSKYNKKVKKTITITVKNVVPTSISLNRKTALLYEGGKSYTLKATLKPTGVYNAGLKWTSSDPDVARVSSKGVVKPLRPGTTEITVKSKEKTGLTATCNVTVKRSKNTKVIKPYTLVGFWNDEKLNYVKVDDNPITSVWEDDTNTYEAVTFKKSNIVGNYVELLDTDNDKKAEIVNIVRFKDGKKKWDSGMEYLDGVGNSTDPVLTDEEGKAMFEGAEYRIPMGERLLKGYGLGDWSGTTDVSNLKDSTYWYDYDYYNLDCSDNLTILPKYKTQLQTTGWTCVLSSALSVLDWYGERGDLNEEDLAALRSDKRKSGRMEGATSLKELVNVFTKLEDLNLTCDWTVESSFDNNREAAEKIRDPQWLKGHLEAGHPIMVIWNSYGGHGQVIIGYDDMGTEATNDDVLIMMDPYDTTDHNANGYNLQSYERLIWGLSGETEDGFSEVRYCVAYPKEGDSEWSYSIDRSGKGIELDPSNTIKSNDENKLNNKMLNTIAEDFIKYYGDQKSQLEEDGWIYINPNTGVGGPLAFEDTTWDGGAFEKRTDKSPYWKFFDFYNSQGPTSTLKMIKNYKTIQQSSEWACGVTSSVMVMEHFGLNEKNETDMSLSKIRQDGEAGPTFIKGIKKIFDYENKVNKEDWVVFTSLEMKYDEENELTYIGKGKNTKYLENGAADNGLIPYLIENNIPVMIGWDEWGGHWQTIIGYDDMGTPDRTQDDVIILADSYDTTDHDMDGYVIESFERLVYGWNAQFESWDSKYASGLDYGVFAVAFPKKGNETVMNTLGLK